MMNQASGNVCGCHLGHFGVSKVVHSVIGNKWQDGPLISNPVASNLKILRKVLCYRDYDFGIVSGTLSWGGGDEIRRIPPYTPPTPGETPPMALLEAHHITKTYSVGNRGITVLEDVSLTVDTGEFIVIAGSSGSGKTTLLTLLSGLDHPSSGRVCIEGRDITDASEEELAPLRNRSVGFVFQSFHLVPSMTALENIMLPAELKGDADAGGRAGRLLARVGLSERADNLPSQLSGGEKQRVALCRALINRPKLIFADEPTGNLDSENGQVVFDQLIDLKNEQGATLILVTHNLEIARTANRVLTLKDGRLTG
jgi:putative ABC transport system ATP-binding protein